jgi:hypothetical protein
MSTEFNELESIDATSAADDDDDWKDLTIDDSDDDEYEFLALPDVDEEYLDDFDGHGLAESNASEGL